MEMLTLDFTCVMKHNEMFSWLVSHKIYIFSDTKYGEKLKNTHIIQVWKSKTNTDDSVLVQSGVEMVHVPLKLSSVVYCQVHFD